MTVSFRVLWGLFNAAEIHPQKIAVVLEAQTWTYSELIDKVEHVACHLHHLNIIQGQIIYQFVERGLEMICGYFGIMCAGGVYCPINPTEPSDRLAVLLEQIKGQYVLIHEKTRNQFPSAAVQHVILLDNILFPFLCAEDIEDLPVCREYGAAYIICTSGTTGRPKAIVHTHKSFSASVNTYIQWDVGMYTSRDHVLQVATSSWVLHLMEIPLALAVGGTLVLLRPSGHLDMAYFSRTLIQQQVTTLTIGPGLIRALTYYLEMSQQLETFKSVRNLCTTGEAMKPQHWTRFISFLSSSDTQICLLYGMSECNGVLGCHMSDVDYTAVPIGYPLPSIQCLLIDERDQVVDNADNQGVVGEIHIGGSNLFNCYLDNPERTATMFVTINNQVYLKTGDLARYNVRGQLVLVGRVDFQIKVRGQRVETAEIENTIINFSPKKISNCLVTKLPLNDDLLVAYVISNDLDLSTEPIRDYCYKQLPQYMVPSYFVVLDKIPLNANGKIDRKQLPLPSLLPDAPTNFAEIEDLSMSHLEKTVHSLWCSMLHLDTISRHMNFFTLGATSLSLMHLFNYYQFHLAPDKQLNVLDFFIDPTIAKHVQLLTNDKPKTDIVWRPLHLVQGVASFAQQRLWMDENVRFNQSVNGQQISVYNELLIYTLSSNTTLSTHRLRQALALIAAKHTTLRTALIYEQDKFIQKVLPVSSNLYDFEVTYVTNDSHLKQILYDEETNRTLFNLEQGRVFRCHVVRRSSKDDDDNNLRQNDIIVFNFHHIAADGYSITIFINDLRQALTTQELPYNNKDDITYLDYAQYERLEDWSDARLYWNTVLTTFSESFDQQNSVAPTGKGHTITFELDHDLVTNLYHFISRSKLTLFQISLAAFFAFLFKMSNSQQLDLCTGIIIANRSRYQLENMIGCFVNTLPFCVRIDPYESFTQLCHRIQQHWLNILPHSHLPFQEIVKLNPELGSSFLRTLFFVETAVDDIEQTLELGDGVTLKIIDQNLLTGDIAKFDMVCILYEHRHKGTISVSLNASLDVYDESVISTMASRLKKIFDQLFSISSVYQFSLLMPHEVELTRDLNNTFLDYGEIGCIHWDFAYQANLHPQKMALVLENGSMTYGELLYYTQRLANYLITKCAVHPGQTVCQLIERSFEMVIGMISIWMAGGVYTPLNLHDPLKRINTCIQQVDGHLILVHQPTHDQSLSEYSLINIDEIICFVQVNKEKTTYIDFVNVTSEHISHIIFTNDATGSLKVVQLRHRNFISCTRSNFIESIDVVLHHTSVAFDVHLSETIGTLIMGGQVILLHPNGSLNMNFFSETIDRQQVTYLNIVPSLWSIIIDHLRITDNKDCLRTLRCILSQGEPLTASNVHNALDFVSEHCRFYNCYGHTECAGTVIQQMITSNNDDIGTLKLGRPIPNVHIYLLDKYLQPTIPGVQTGEIVIGGSDLFSSYYGREDLTRAVLCDFNGEICFKTGDLGWLNITNRQLEFRGCRDHQLKLRRYSTELEEVKSVLMQMATNCIVIKAKHFDIYYLVAYIQTTYTIQDLKQHCLARLPVYLVPCVFKIFDILPVNQAGEINRTNLPPPDFTSLSMLSNAEKLPRTEMEQRVYKIWCQALSQIDLIPSIWTSFFSFGDDPGSFIRLIHLYSISFKHNLPTITFLKQPTVAEHARLLLENATMGTSFSKQIAIDQC